MTKMLDVEQLREVVENDGLGYAIQNGVAPEEVEDDDLREKWEQAADLLNEIEEALSE